jgi:hypothetical protein
LAKAYTYKPGIHINKQVKFMGLDGYQLLIVLVLFILLFFIKMFLPILFLFPLIFVLTKIKREIKRGNPSPVGSYFLKDKIKRNVVDSDNVLNKIFQNGLSNGNNNDKLE